MGTVSASRTTAGRTREGLCAFLQTVGVEGVTAGPFTETAWPPGLCPQETLTPDMVEQNLENA